jgi:hypothetical protein
LPQLGNPDAPTWIRRVEAEPAWVDSLEPPEAEPEPAPDPRPRARWPKQPIETQPFVPTSRPPSRTPQTGQPAGAPTSATFRTGDVIVTRTPPGTADNPRPTLLHGANMHEQTGQPVPRTHLPRQRSPSRVRLPLPPMPDVQEIANRGSSQLGRWLLIVLLAGLATGAVIFAMRNKPKPTEPAKPVELPAAVAAVGADRLELAADRRSIARVGGAGARWTARLPTVIDRMDVDAGFVLARTRSSLVAIDPERGDQRFSWDLPTGETFGVAPPAMLGACFAVFAVKGGNALMHCLDPMTGTQTWTARIAAGQDCAASPIAIVGAFAVQCASGTAVIDDHTGDVTVEADGLGVVQREPALLLRNRDGRLVLSGYSPALHRFSPQATPRGTVEAPASALQRNGKLIVRASSTSNLIATIVPKTGAAIPISVPELQLANEVPFVSDCDLAGPPRFQLVELAPKAGEAFDPELAHQRVLALVDTEAGRVTWTSKRFVPPRRARTSAGSICRKGHFLVPVPSGLWIVDANSGETRGAYALTGGGSLAELGPEQVGDDVLVGMSPGGPFSISWRHTDKLPDGLRDATADIERELGKLP